MNFKGKDKYAHLISQIDDAKVTECWVWNGTRNKAGYGRALNGLAHRKMYEIVYGDITEGLVVMHTCDNPPCINPLHLKMGTHLDNNQDKIDKGRARYNETGTRVSKGAKSSGLKGEANNRAKLTVQQVAEIRKLYKGRQNRMTENTGMTLKQLAEKYGMGISQISRIIHRVHW